MRFNNKNYPLPILPSAKYQKVTDWSTLVDGDEIVFVNESTGLVCSTQFIHSTSTTATQKKGPILSDEHVNISNNEFNESDLSNIQKSTYTDGSSSLTRDANALVLKLMSNNDGFALYSDYYNNVNSKPYLYLSGTGSNRKMDFNADMKKWTFNSNSVEYTETTSGNYRFCKATGNSYNTYWVSNYASNFEELWTFAIYKKVQ